MLTFGLFKEESRLCLKPETKEIASIHTINSGVELRTHETRACTKLQGREASSKNGKDSKIELDMYDYTYSEH